MIGKKKDDKLNCDCDMGYENIIGDTVTLHVTATTIDMVFYLEFKQFTLL